MRRRFTPNRTAHTGKKFNNNSFKYRQILTSNSKNIKRNQSRERRLLRTSSTHNFKPSVSVEFDDYNTGVIENNSIRAKIEKIRREKKDNRTLRGRLLFGKTTGNGEKFLNNAFAKKDNTAQLIKRRGSYTNNRKKEITLSVKKKFASSLGMKRYGSVQRISHNSSEKNFTKRDNPEYVKNYRCMNYENHYFVGPTRNNIEEGISRDNNTEVYFRKNKNKLYASYNQNLTRSMNLKKKISDESLSGNMTPISKESRNAVDGETDIDEEIKIRLEKLMKDVESLSNTIKKRSQKNIRKADVKSMKNRSRKISQNNSEKEAMSEQLNLKSLRKSNDLGRFFKDKKVSKFKAKNLGDYSRGPVHKITRVTPSFKEDELDYHYKGSSGLETASLNRRKSGFVNSSRNDDTSSVNNLDLANMSPSELKQLSKKIENVLKKKIYPSPSKNDDESYESGRISANYIEESDEFENLKKVRKGQMMRQYLRPQTADSPRNLKNKNKKLQSNLKKGKVAKNFKQKKYFAYMKKKKDKPKFIKIENRAREKEEITSEEERAKMLLNNQNSTTNSTLEKPSKKLPPRSINMKKIIQEKSEENFEQESFDIDLKNNISDLKNSPILNDTFPFRESNILTLSKDSITEMDHFTTNPTYVDSDISYLEIKKNIEQMRQGMGIPFSGSLLSDINMGSDIQE